MPRPDFSPRASSKPDDRRPAHGLGGILPAKVDIGCHTTIEDTETGEQRTFVIGSHHVLDQQHENEISYAAPVAKPLLGARVGEEREVTIGNRTAVFRVIGAE